MITGLLVQCYIIVPVTSRISRNKFIKTRRYLDFVDNTTLPKNGEDGYDKLGKIRQLLIL